MTALERTLDTLFGDIDDLISDYQKPQDNFLEYNGETIYEPAPFSDRGRVMIDLIDRFERMYPGIIITDTEFITSGYFAFKFPNIGPYHDVECYINRTSDNEIIYELLVQWQGYSQSAGTFNILTNLGADEFDNALSRVLGSLFIKTFNGLTIFNNQERFRDDFPVYSCKNISFKKVFEDINITFTDIALTLMGREWSSIIQHFTPNNNYRIYHDTQQQDNYSYIPQDVFSVGDMLILKVRNKYERAKVIKITTYPRKPSEYTIRNQRGTTYKLTAKPSSQAKVFILGKEVDTPAT